MDVKSVTILTWSRWRARWRLSGAAWMLVVWTALVCMPVIQSLVYCNEFDTCFSTEKRINITDSIRAGNRQQVCHVATAAIECLNEARKDCDNGYKNLPESIITGLETRRNNLSSYTATYCENNHSCGLVSTSTATLLWTLFVCFRVVS